MAHKRVEVLEGCLEKEKCALRTAVTENEILQVWVSNVLTVVCVSVGEVDHLIVQYVTLHVISLTPLRVQEKVKCLEGAVSEEKSCRETIEKVARYCVHVGRLFTDTG